MSPAKFCTFCKEKKNVTFALRKSYDRSLSLNAILKKPCKTMVYLCAQKIGMF